MISEINKEIRMTQKRDYTPSEAEEQMTLFRWAAEMAVYKWPELNLLHHIANGGSRHKIEAARLKAQGVKPGIPDVFLPVPRKGYHGLYIEMKRQKGGTVSQDQKEMIEALQYQGYRVEVCKGFHAAANVIEEYMEG